MEESKTKPKHGKYTEVVNFYLMPEELKMLDELSGGEGLGRSQWLRMMIRRAHRKINPSQM